MTIYNWCHKHNHAITRAPYSNDFSNFLKCVCIKFLLCNILPELI